MADLLQSPQNLDAALAAGEITYDQLKAGYLAWYAAVDAGTQESTATPTTIDIVGGAVKQSFPLWLLILGCGAILYYASEDLPREDQYA